MDYLITRLDCQGKFQGDRSMTSRYEFAVRQINVPLACFGTRIEKFSYAAPHLRIRSA